MIPLTDDKIKILTATANDIRQLIITSLVAAGSGHTAGPLGMADVFTLLYFHVLNHDPSRPDWPERDRLVLSNGHICPVLYATMARAGYFGEDELLTLRQFGSRLQGHPHRDFLPALETSSGPLGSGLSQAVGMALAGRLDNPTTGPFIYCLMSDAEQECGQTWEAAMLAGKEGLGNLIAIIDRNNIQIDGYTEDIMPLEPLRKKWEAFNWHVQEIDGHNAEEIEAALKQSNAIIAHTTKGKGVSFLEGHGKWHHRIPNKEEYAAIMEELK